MTEGRKGMKGGKDRPEGEKEGRYRGGEAGGINEERKGERIGGRGKW